MNSVLEAHGWRVRAAWCDLRGSLRRLAADMAAVAWCHARGAHSLEPDPEGGQHEWCGACGWCPSCGARITGEPEVLP